MNITIVGTGYVGLVTGTCFAEMGNRVFCVDIDKEKIADLNKGIIPIYEPGLERMVIENSKRKSLFFTTDLKQAMHNSEVVFIAVGTPQGEDGSADLQYVLHVAEDIGKFMTSPIIIVDKSTVPVGTAEKVENTVRRILKERGVDIKFSVVSNPEFLKEGDAINDFMKPDRVIIGADDEKIISIMKELYAPFTRNHERFIGMDVKSAEMTKYTANAMLATKISFMNEISRICEAVGADVNKVRIGIGSDKRIGFHFIYPGCGYGGSCFPKDVKALEKIAIENGVKPNIISAVEQVNNEQKRILAEKVKKKFGNDLSGKKFCIWGLSFKPGTDDMREAPAIIVIELLKECGAEISVYDPKATEQAKEIYLKKYDNIRYYNNKYDPMNNADALILITEWKEFRSPDFYEMKKRLKNPVIFDGRNIYNSEKLEEMGFEYYQIGVNRLLKNSEDKTDNVS